MLKNILLGVSGLLLSGSVGQEAAAAVVYGSFAEAAAVGGNGSERNTDGVLGATDGPVAASAQASRDGAAVSVSVDSAAGTARFSANAACAGCLATAGYNLVDTLTLSMPGAAPDQETPFSITLKFDGAASFDTNIVETSNYTLSFFSRGQETSHIEGIFNAGSQIFQDGPSLDRPFSPYSLTSNLVLRGSEGQFGFSLIGGGSASGDASLAFSNTASISVVLSPGMSAVSAAAQGTPDYVSTVPMPAALPLFVSGLLGLAAYRRSRPSA